MTPPRQLRQRIRAGDDSAFVELYRAHVTAVFNLAHRVTGNWATAEDVTSETFVVAWRSREQVAIDDRPLIGWLLAIAANQSLNATRSVRRRHSFLARATEAVVDDFSELTISRIDDAARLARTREAMRLLSRAEAEVLALCVWSGLSYAEAAQELAIPVGTVRSRLARARDRLRTLSEPPPPSQPTLAREGQP